MSGDYEIYIGYGSFGNLHQSYFECDCGRELKAEPIECSQCGSTYEVTEDGYIRQVSEK